PADLSRLWYQISVRAFPCSKELEAVRGERLLPLVLVRLDEVIDEALVTDTAGAAKVVIRVAVLREQCWVLLPEGIASELPFRRRSKRPPIPVEMIERHRNQALSAFVRAICGPPKRLVLNDRVGEPIGVHVVFLDQNYIGCEKEIQ